MRLVSTPVGLRSFPKAWMPLADGWVRIRRGGPGPNRWGGLALVAGVAILAAALPGCGTKSDVAMKVGGLEQYDPSDSSSRYKGTRYLPETSIVPVAYDESAPLLMTSDELNVELGPEPIDPAQSMVALDKETGRIVWRRPRDGDHAYSTPLSIEMDGVPQIVSVSGHGVASYDPESGRELWWCRHHGHTVVPRPVFGHGMVFFCTGYEAPLLFAVDPSGEYDVTDTHVRWQTEKGAPFNPSPLLVGTQLYLMGDRGTLSCYDAILGTLVWEHRLPGNYWASPIEVDGQVVVINHDGVASVIEPGDEFKLVATNVIDSPVQASPAVSGKSLFLRTANHVYRIADSTDDGDAPVDWPQFRGPTGDGIAGSRGMNLRWSESKNIVWKKEIPGKGWSSPVIAGGQVWLTTAVEESDGAVSMRALCLDRTTGKTQHDIEVLRKQSPEETHPMYGHATPTPVIDGDRVYVHFGANATACLSTDGKLLWRTRLPYHQYYGPCGSPIVCGNLVVINCDGYDGPYDRGSDSATDSSSEGAADSIPEEVGTEN